MIHALAAGPGWPTSRVGRRWPGPPRPDRARSARGWGMPRMMVEEAQRDADGS